jgi:hypothetical protein
VHAVLHVEADGNFLTVMQTPEDSVDQRVKLASEEAVYWYVRATQGDLSLADSRKLMYWLRRSPENISEMLRISDVSRSLCKVLDIHAVHFGPARRHDRITSRFLRLRSEARHRNSRKIALSLTYFSHLRRQHVYSKLTLLSVALCAVGLGLILENTQSLSLAGISLASLALLIIKEFVVGYRVSKGFFGSTESEARDLVQFIMENANEIDFTDGDGKRRPPLVTEPQQSVIGEPAPRGVLSR